MQGNVRYSSTSQTSHSITVKLSESPPKQSLHSWTVSGLWPYLKFRKIRMRIQFSPVNRNPDWFIYRTSKEMTDTALSSAGRVVLILSIPCPACIKYLINLINPVWTTKERCKTCWAYEEWIQSFQSWVLEQGHHWTHRKDRLLRKHCFRAAF